MRRRANGDVRIRTGRSASRVGAILFALACSTPNDGSVGTSAQQLNTTPALGDFVLYAGESVVIDGNVTVTGGDVGVATTTTSSPQLSIGSRSDMDPTRTLVAPSVWLNSLATTGDIETNSLDQNGATVGTVASYPTSMPPLPIVTAPTAYGSDVTVANNSSATLTAGTYRVLSVGGGSSIALGAGTYVFQSVTLSPHASLSVSGAVHLDVGGSVSIAGNCSLGDSKASDLTLAVAATDTTSDAGVVPAVSIGSHSNMTALVLAPNGTVDIVGTASVTGEYVGLAVHVGSHAKATFGAALESDAGSDASSDATAQDATSGDAAVDAAVQDAAVEAEAGPTCDPQTCDDHNACNGVETCQNNACTAGTPPVVDDGNPCTVDSCDPQSGVSHTPTPSGSSCGSMNVCTGTQTCNGFGACVQNPPAVVDDGNPCTIDSCDPQNGVTHTLATAGASCGSTDLCTGTQTCNSSGSCVQNPPVVIDDGNPCTVDTCDPQQGALHTASPQGTICGSADVCTGVLACDGAGTCVQGPPAVVDDGNACTTDTCDPQSGVAHTPVPQGSACADNSDLCVGAFTCDANATCVQGPAPTLDDGNLCTTDSCDPQSGVIHTPVAPGTACANNSNLCIGAYTCNANATCTQAPDPVVDDNNICTTDSCDPQSGVVHTPIQGCDPSPTKGNNPFEAQASLLGRVINGNGMGVTGATFQVFDAPSTVPRTDLQVSTGADGSFRVRLTQFPSSESPDSPPHHLLLTVDVPNTIRAFRDVYVHPGTAYDFGPIKVVGRDPSITNIGPGGGTASDSLNRVTVIIPPGALNTTIPVQITPFVNRDELPYPLPDSTATMYGVELEPNGTTFALPVTVHLTNWRSVPTNMTIPVGYFDEVNGHWEHMATATWTGTVFTFPTTHFSSIDCNGAKAGQTGDLLVYYGDGANANTSEQKCGFSSIGVANGSVQQTFSLPVYQDRSTPYGVTLNYNSGLAGSRSLQDGSQTYTGAAAVSTSPVSVAVQRAHFGAVCVPRGSSAANGAPGVCNAGTCTLGASTLGYSVQSYFGSGTSATTASLSAGTKAMDVGAWLDLPDDGSGDPIGSSFVTQHAVLVASGSGACVSGGGTFGVSDINGTPQQTSLDPGPVASVERHVFVHHRHNSPYGAGWAIENVNELYIDHGSDHAMLVHGDATEEEFRPRATYAPGPVPNSGTVHYTAFARDKNTSEDFLINDHGVLAKFDPSTTAMVSTTVQTGLALGTGAVTPQGLAIGYVGGQRHWVYATHDGLRDFDGANTTLLQGRTATDTNIYTQAHVAANNDLVFYTDGDPNHPVVYRTRLSDPQHVVSAITATAGDQRLDPKGTPASGVQLTDPAGLAFGADGSLYVADRRRNVVLRFGLDANNEVGPNSPVTHLLGNGLSGVLVPPGDRIDAKHFTLNQPVFLSTSDDGTLLIQTSFGVAQYNPATTEAEWLFFDSNVITGLTPDTAYSALDFSLSGPGAGLMGAILALSPTSMMIDATVTTKLYRFDVALASKYDPYRTLATSNGTTFLDDPVAEMTEAYDASGRMTERRRRSGEMLLAVQYVGATNAIDKLIDPDNNATTFTYDPTSGKLAGITDPRIRTTLVTVNGFGDLESFREPDSEVRSFLYSGHHMTQKTSPAGDPTSYEYTSDGVVTKVTKANGEFATFVPPLTQPATYSALQNPVHSGSFTDEHGVTHAIVINQRGDIERDQWTADSVTYTRQSIYASLLSTKGSTAAPQRNSLFRVSSHQLNGAQEDLDAQWDELGRFQGLQDSTDTTQNIENRALLTYDKNGYLSSYRGPEPNGYDTHIIERDLAGHITHVYVPNPGGVFGPETFYTYNRTDGQPDTVTVHGVTYTLDYDANGNLKSSVDTAGLGIKTNLTRDLYGNVATVNDGQASWAFSYDENNRLVTATDANFNTTHYGYTIMGCGCSEADRLTSIQTPDLIVPDLKWTLDYGPEGRLKTITDPDGKPTPLGHQTSLTYQATGELTQVVDANQHGASMTYDSLGRLSQAFDALGRAHARSYPVPNSTGWSGPSVMSGGPTSTPVTTDFTQPLDNGQYQIGLNLFQTKGDPAQVSFYRDATFELSYGMQWDQARRMTRRDDRVGLPISSTTVTPSGHGQYNTAQISYNLSSSDPVVSSISSVDASVTESASFSQNADYDDTQVQGWRLRLPSVTETLTRDVAGRITAHTRQFTSNNGDSTIPAGLGAGFTGPQTTYTYSPSNGRVTNFTDADGSHDVFYDTRGLVSKITVAGEGDYVFTYDELGRNSEVDYPGGLVRTQVYDHEGRLTQRCYTYNGFDPRCYGALYDGAGNPRTMSDPEGSYAFGYDALDRLQQSTRTATNQSDELEAYDYNALGALHTNAGVTLDDQRPKLAGGGTADAAVPATYNSQPITLDPSGRITTLFGNTLAYNRRGRLISITHPPVNNNTNTEYYGYDAQMRRIGRFGVVNGTPSATDKEYFIWDGANLVASIDKTSHVNESWFYEGVDQPLRLTAGSLRYFYELDLAGNVRRLRRPDGTDAGGYRYTAFGQQLPADLLTPAAQVDQPLRWKARQWSDFGQLYDVRARWWSPQLGVFTSVDELRLSNDQVLSGTIRSDVTALNPSGPDTVAPSTPTSEQPSATDWFALAHNDDASEIVGTRIYSLLGHVEGADRVLGKCVPLAGSSTTLWGWPHQSPTRWQDISGRGDPVACVLAGLFIEGLCLSRGVPGEVCRAVKEAFVTWCTGKPEEPPNLNSCGSTPFGITLPGFGAGGGRSAGGFIGGGGQTGGGGSGRSFGGGGASDDF